MLRRIVQKSRSSDIKAWSTVNMPKTNKNKAANAFQMKKNKARIWLIEFNQYWGCTKSFKQ